MNREILLKFLKCEATPEEERTVLDWLEASPAHRTEMNRMDETFNALVLHAPAGAEIRRRRVFGVRRVIRSAAAAAAAIALVAGSGWFFTQRQMMRLSEQMTSLDVPAGQRINVTLQDGTKVWLNAGSTLQYPLVFSGRDRRVKISGEAMFEVEHDAHHPFIVETFACDVEVLGTKFNVEADEASGLFTTALMRGRVKVTNRLAAEQVYLNPDECVSLVGNRLSVERISDPDEYLWTEGILNLKSASFEELIVKFEKAYDIKIRVLRKQLPRIESRGKVRVSEGIEHVLDILKMDADFTYVHNRETNEILIK